MTDPYQSTTPGFPGSGATSWGRASGPRAGFWRRLAADLLDGIVLLIIGLILGVILHGHAGDYLGFVVGIVYFTAFEGSPRSASPGKQVLGIRVIDANTGEPIGYPRAFIRYITSILSAVVFLLGYLWMLWDREKQCWHDKFAGDVVVPTADYPVRQSATARLR